MNPLRQDLGPRLAQGPLPALRVMAEALYHPQHGYYRRPESPWGLEGADYYTAVDVGPLLGETLARRLEQAWEELGCPAVFPVLEPGAGRGWLGRDLLQSAREPFATALRYLHQDDSPAGRRLAEGALAPWLATGQASFLSEQDPVAPFTGAIVALELLDALPAQPYRWIGDTWEMEVLTPGGSAWIPAPEGEATAWMESHGPLQEGDGAAWCEGLPGWVAEASRILKRGLLVVIDYGDTTSRLLEKGTGLRRYRAHRTDSLWWEDLGDCDLTADVDFTWLAHLLRASGLEAAPSLHLETWIRRHAPFPEWEAAWATLAPPERLARQENLKELLLRMGRSFRVLEAVR